MRLECCVWAGAVLALLTSSAAAQGVSPSGAQVRVPAQWSSAYSTYSDSAAPGAVTPVTYASADCGCAADPGCGVASYGDCCGACGGGGCTSCCGGCDWCDLGDAWTLWSHMSYCEDPVLNVGGWFQMGYHSDNTPLSNNRGDVLSFNDVPDSINLHQAWLFVEKVADASCGADWGFRADVMYGTDAQKTQAFGNPAGSWDFQNGFDHGIYGWAIPQLYGEIAMGDWSIKAGHFYTLVGYEVVTAPDNFFYSHALTMFNSEPFTHTGALGTYTGFDDVTFYAGWTAGWDSGFDSVNGGSSWLGGLSVSAWEDMTITYISTGGNFGARGDNGYSHSIVADYAINDKWNYVFQSDLVRVDSTGDDDVGINQYLFYNYNECVAFGTRFEWWKDEGISYHEWTGGVNIRPHANLILRPEIRYDWSPTTANPNVAYTDGNRTTFGVDMILTY